MKKDYLYLGALGILAYLFIREKSNNKKIIKACNEMLAIKDQEFNSNFNIMFVYFFSC